MEKSRKQDMNPELIQEALEKDWRPLWLPVAIEEDGTADERKYHTERHHLHNAVIGFVIPEGPRELGDKINLEHKRWPN